MAKSIGPARGLDEANLAPRGGPLWLSRLRGLPEGKVARGLLVLSANAERALAFLEECNVVHQAAVR